MARFFIGICKVIAGLMLLVILALVVFSPAWAARPEDVKVPAFTPIPTAPPPETTPEPTEQAAPVQTPTPEPTATPEPTPEPTPEVAPEQYTISMVGDCTLASYPEIKFWDTAFENVTKGNWAYPFSHTKELFEADDLTLVNLECSISDLQAYAGTTFSFLAPAEAVKYLTEGGVEAATMANNHAFDFGQAVYDDTAANLKAAGLQTCGDGDSFLYTTESGFVIGVYATYNWHTPVADAVANGVRSLKDSGADAVVVYAHWGNEASYYQNANQVEVAHAAIDAGALVVAGHGPHRLEPYEEYHGGVIFYSLGNFVFGGNTIPQDMDSVIAQVVLQRGEDGTVFISEARALPCSISSQKTVNDYCPTLFEKGTEDYKRALSKVDGSWNGANNVIDYSFMHPDQENEG